MQTIACVLALGYQALALVSLRCISSIQYEVEWSFSKRNFKDDGGCSPQAATTQPLDHVIVAYSNRMEKGDG